MNYKKKQTRKNNQSVYFSFFFVAVWRFFLSSPEAGERGRRRVGVKSCARCSERSHGERREHGPAPRLQGTQHAPEAAHARPGGTGREVRERPGKFKTTVFVCVSLCSPQAALSWDADRCARVCSLVVFVQRSCPLLSRRKGHSDLKKKKFPSVQKLGAFSLI